MMEHVPYPRLLKDNGDFDRTIIPVSASINLRITPLSYASLDLPMHETIEERSYIELFTPFGSAGVFRVRSPSDTYGEGMITTAELEHAIVEVGDYIVRTKYDEMMAAGTAMQTIFSHYRGNRWQLGSVAAMGTGQIAVQADHVRVLEAMLSLLEQCPSCMLSFDFSTKPWTVSVVSRGTVVSAEGRLSRNVNGARIIYDDTELCTRAYYEISSTGGDGEPSSTWTSMDADTINVYGVVERDVPAGTDLTPAEAQRVVTEYLRKHKHPRISVEINAEELSNITGEPLDAFTIGKLFRLSLPDYNKTVEQVVTAVAWGDVYSNPYDMTVSLAEEEDTAITFLHDLDAKGGSGGGGAAQKEAEKVIRESKTEREKDRYSWEMVKTLTDNNDKILKQAGIQLDPKGAIIYATDNKQMLGSKFQVQANQISMVVGGTEDNPKIKAAEIVASVNEEGSNIKISASHIDIDGILSAQEFETKLAHLDTVVGDFDVKGAVSVGGRLDAGIIATESSVTADGNIEAGSFLSAELGVIVGGNTATWQSKNVRYCTLSTSRPFCYGSTSGISGTVTGSLVLSYTDSTIYYLGR